MLLAASLEKPHVSQFLNHPDFPTVAAFFFGWVFYASLSALWTSSQLKGIAMYFRKLLVPATRQPPAGSRDSMGKSVDDTSSIHAPSSRGDSLQHILILMLFVCFLTGSLANFGSLLSFNANGELCAFTVAWGVLSTETARLMGVFVLLLTLRHLGMRRWELIASLIWLVIALVFVFIEAALATSVTLAIEPLDISLCFRRHFLPAAVVSSAMYIILEVFIVIRLCTRIPRDSLQQRWAKLFDIRVLRALSLVVITLLTAVPSATVTNILAESIPYSIGAIIVLLAFSHKADDWELSNGRDSEMSPSFEPASAGLPISARDVAPFNAPTYSTWVPGHPYSANSLSNPELLLQPWEEDQQQQGTRTARMSTRTIDTTAARSIRNAVIQQARRERLPATSTADEPPRSTTLDPQSAKNVAKSRKPDLTLQLQQWEEDQQQQGSRTARTTRTIDTSVARSIRDAVIQQARRERLPATSTADEPPRETTLEPRSTQQELRKPDPTLKSLRPKLLIVTRPPNDPATGSETSERRRTLLSSIHLDTTITSHFSSPSLSTGDSRSTITYPASARTRPISYDPRDTPSVIVDDTDTDSESYDLEDGIAAMELGARITTNPDLLAPVASPSGPRFPRR